MDAELVARVENVVRLTPTIVEVVVKAPAAARRFHPGQFYRLQNFESAAPRVAAGGRSIPLLMEGVALTGAWVDKERGLLSLIALELGVAIPTIAAAIDARVLSSMKAERETAAAVLRGPRAAHDAPRDAVIDDLAAALYASRICAYAQGMALIRAGSHAYRWSIDLAEIGRIWKGGCIIRARLLDPVRHAFGSTPDLANLLLDPDLARAVDGAQAGWRRTVGRAAAAGGEEMIRRESGRIVVSGPVTLANVAAVLEEARRHLEEGVRTVDLGEVTEIDSSLLAAMLAWLRDARRQGAELVFANLPESVRTIAHLYGLDGLIPVAEAAASR